MKTYNYKIQWIFNVQSGFIAPKEQLRKELYSVIRALGAKSLTVINFLDANFKSIDNYSNMVMYPYGTANRETIKYIKKVLSKNDNIAMVELLRR